MRDANWLATREELLRAGYSRRQITRAVAAGELLRVRNGHYARPGAPPRVLQAVRIGGIAGCVTAAKLLGLWVDEGNFTHVRMRREASRPRSPGDRRRPLTAANRDGCHLHWSPLLYPDDADAASVGLLDALGQIARCKPLGVAVAALDSALNQRKVSLVQLRDLFVQLPARCGRVLELADGRCMSGLETAVRVMSLANGWLTEPQVTFAGIGTVDLVIEGCVVVETDGREWHSGETAVARDYVRDAALAALGYTVLRFSYAQVMFYPEVVIAAIESALRMHRRGPVM